MHAITQNLVTEWSFTCARAHADPFADIELDVIFTDEAGTEQAVPAFWAGGNVWRVRFSSPSLGRYTYVARCSDASDSGLHGQEGEFEVTPYNGPNPLCKHGPISVSSDARQFEHLDGTPFFWLADTQWMGLCKRIAWPDEFQELAMDRARKGFSVVQIVAGLYPDMPPEDERGLNEAGLPWEPAFSTINPAYFDMADRRLLYLIDLGLVPCIVGCWGYYLPAMGETKMKQHWRYLIARYGAYPVIWCAAGEALMPFYTSTEDNGEYWPRARTQWTEMTRYIRSLDPFGRMVTIHPGGPSGSGDDMVDDPSVVDFTMLQTGHLGHFDYAHTLRTLATALEHEPKKPVLNSEAAYEGIVEMNREEIQRLFFWSCVLGGAAGHTYGANGVWQLNTSERPYGPSPHGASWGDTPWQIAAQLPGSAHVGVGRRILERYPWQEMEPHQEWVETGQISMYQPEHASFAVSRAAGIPGRLRMVYISPLLGGLLKVKGIEPGVVYGAAWINPSDGSQFDIGEVVPDEMGDWSVPGGPAMRDWVLVLEAQSEERT